MHVCVHQVGRVAHDQPGERAGERGVEAPLDQSVPHHPDIDTDSLRLHLEQPADRTRHRHSGTPVDEPSGEFDEHTLGAPHLQRVADMEDPPTRNHVVLELVEQLGMVSCIDQAFEGAGHGNLLRRLKWSMTRGASPGRPDRALCQASGQIDREHEKRAESPEPLRMTGCQHHMDRAGSWSSPPEKWQRGASRGIWIRRASQASDLGHEWGVPLGLNRNSVGTGTTVETSGFLRGGRSLPIQIRPAHRHLNKRAAF